MFKVSNRHTGKRSEICPKLTITPLVSFWCLLHRHCIIIVWHNKLFSVRSCFKSLLTQIAFLLNLSIRIIKFEDVTSQELFLREHNTYEINLAKSFGLLLLLKFFSPPYIMKWFRCSLINKKV